MMPLTLADMGTPYTIRRVGGSQELKKHLEDMGFVVGGEVTIINMLGGNVIANIKDTRVGISKELAQKIMV